jgi:hypothetical protein
MPFVYHGDFLGAAKKADGFFGSMGGVGPACPPSVLAFCSMGAQEREFRVYLYDQEGRETKAIIPFSSVPIQDGSVERINVTGSPVVVLHDQVVKVFYTDFFARALYRLNTGWRLEP